MSDSGLPAIETFAQGHALTAAAHQRSNPVMVTISGDINSFNLTVPDLRGDRGCRRHL